MKKYILFLAACLLILLAANVDAQFEVAANKVINKNDSQNDNSSSNSYPDKSYNGGDQYTANFAKYKISSALAYNSSDIKQPYSIWHNEYSHYEVRNNAIVDYIYIYAASREDEAGDLLDNTVGYIFENGKMVKKTSIDAIENQKKSLEAAYSKYDWPYGAGDEVGNYEAYKSGATGPRAYINFNGKQYGPFMMISALNVSKDKSKFFGIGAKMDINSGDIGYYLFSSYGKEIKLPSMPAGTIFNINCSQAGATGFMDPNSDDAPSANNMNYHDIYFADGTVRKNVSGLGPAATAWLDPGGKNILAVGQNSGAWINGKKVTNNNITAGNLWCSPDGSRWCYVYTDSKETGHLVFSDGADVRGFFHPQQLVIGSKTYMAWLQYKDVTGKVLLFCTKEL